VYPGAGEILLDKLHVTRKTCPKNLVWIMDQSEKKCRFKIYSYIKKARSLKKRKNKIIRK
jgi:hypothetical protein